jgi:hypothetical protein
MIWRGIVTARRSQWFFCCTNVVVYFAAPPQDNRSTETCQYSSRPGGGLDTVFHKFLQFDSIIAFMRYIDALEFIHVYASGGRNDNFSFHLGHRILHERLRKTRVQNGYGELQGQSLRQESSPPSACARVVHRRAAEQ